MKRLSLTLQALIKFGLQAEFYAFRQLRIVEKFAYDIGGKISRDLRRRRPDWLRRNAGVAVMAVRNDYEDWCKLRGDKYKKLFGIT